MKSISNVVRAGWALAALNLSACMFSPTEDQQVSSTAESVQFMGYDRAGDREILIEAFDPATRSYERIATTRTSTQSQAFEGLDWYQFDTQRQVPPAYWVEGGKGGSFARVRAMRANGEEIHSIKRNWLDCYNASGRSIVYFLTRCLGADSPNAYLYTRDYPTQVDLVLSSVWLTPSGIQMRIKNEGRMGHVTRLECRAAGQSWVNSRVRRRIRPGESVQLSLSGSPGLGRQVQCLVRGENLNGTPEPVTCTGEPPTCGDNSLTRRL